MMIIGSLQVEVGNRFPIIFRNGKYYLGSQVQIILNLYRVILEIGSINLKSYLSIGNIGSIQIIILKLRKVFIELEQYRILLVLLFYIFISLYTLLNIYQQVPRNYLDNRLVIYLNIFIPLISFNTLSLFFNLLDYFCFLYIITLNLFLLLLYLPKNLVSLY